MHILIFALFLFSGMAGLIYQIVWIKLLALVFGVTLLAISTVLASFFGGLALGSWLGGKWVDRRGDGFKWYGIAEIIIGAFALVFLNLLDLNNSVYALIAHKFSTNFYALSVLKFVLSAILLIIPTTLMGATLPILSKALARSETRFAKDIGGLYAINTIGAVIGTVLTAFFLIPSLGISAVIYLTACLNIIIGVIALLINKSHKETAAPANVPLSSNRAGEKELPDYFAFILIAGFAISGFTGLAYEVIWSRILGFILTGTVYAFSAVLAVFLVGIALGSYSFSLFLDRVKKPSTLVMILACVEVLIGVSAIFLLNLFEKIPSLDFYPAIDSTPHWGEFIYLNFLTSFITLFAPAYLFGATFPVICKIYNMRNTDTGTKIGNIYSLNTVGGIFGSFASGFVLIPFLGMQNALIAMGIVNIILGAVFALTNPFTPKPQKAVFIAVSAGLAAAALFFAPANMPLSLHKAFLTRGEDIVFYEEGATATVMIAERKGMDLNASNKRLWVNGNRATAAYYEGLQINRFQGVLPNVLHPNPKDVLVICFGSGTTFGTLSQFPVTQVDNVEIAGTVVKGAPHFTKENMDVLHNPKSRIIIDDGRSYLAATSKKYDIITEEPMHPALVGVVNLYTKEYYELAKSRLKEGGIISQWIPLYNLSTEDVRTMVKTFQSVFPHTTIWLANTDIFMIGSPERTVIDLDKLERSLEMPNIKSLLTDIDLEDKHEFLSTFIMNEDMVREYAKDAPVMTDNNPLVEYIGPRSLNVNTISPNLGEMLKYREPVYGYIKTSSPEKLSMLKERLDLKYASSGYNIVGRAYFADNNLPMAAEYFRKALGIDPADRNSLHYRQNLKFY